MSRTPNFLPILTFLLGVLALSLGIPTPVQAQKKPRGKTFHVHPQRGKDSGNGSRTRPWKTLSEVARSGALDRLTGGDTVLLYNGNHGQATLAGGPSAGIIRIAAAPKHKPALGGLIVTGGRGWHFQGLTISPSFLPSSERGNRKSIVELGDRRESSDMTLEDCFLYTTLDTTSWSVEDWIRAPRGIFVGRKSNGLVIRNNHVLNTRHGILLGGEQSICEANIVEHFSGDGIRVTRDGIQVRHNLIKNVRCSPADGDRNHDDGIQCFLFNKGTGTVRDVTIEDNIILNHDVEPKNFPSIMQGIGFFDGPLIDFVVTGNIVLVPHWHGVSLYDAQNCRIENNVCYSRWTQDRKKPWVQLGQKKQLSQKNTVRNNFAHTFRLDADSQVQQSGNRPITPRIFHQRFTRLARMIAKTYGTHHRVSEQPRFLTLPRE